MKWRTFHFENCQREKAEEVENVKTKETYSSSSAFSPDSLESDNLKDWVTALSLAKSKGELFRLLDRFRLLNWTDKERAEMSQKYIAVIRRLP